MKISALILMVPLIFAQCPGASAQARQKADSKAALSAVSNYIYDKSKATGTFDIYDPEIGKTRMLTLSRLSEKAGKTADKLYVRALFTDTQTGEVIDLDFDVAQDKNGALTVSGTRIHKVNGEERYIYGDKDNRVPVIR